ncbi:hypothetical protein ABT063_04555 [Streptomyces sp. NPDC002838]|uniref:hypothetical protein n=1 Tax=Streptomyces sp. NPDC002838 TaxID=3154436 RepID=UPI00332B8424
MRPRRPRPVDIGRGLDAHGGHDALVLAAFVSRAVKEAGAGGVVVAPVHWTPVGILPGLALTAPAVGLAAVAVTGPRLLAAPERALPLRRLRSGHVGDYVAWALVGATLLGALALPGVLGA